MLGSVVREIKASSQNPNISQQKSLLPVQRDWLSACWSLSMNHRHRALFRGASLSLVGQVVFLYSWQHLGH